MFLRKILMASLLLGGATITVAQESRFGTPATQADIDKRFWSTFPDGENLPDGQGTAMLGKPLFEEQCTICHGTPEARGENDVLFGGHGTIGTDKALATVGSYWPYATTVFNYIRKAMPYTAPMSMTNSEYYSITAYLLYENGIIGEEDVINKETLPDVKMPNAGNFIMAYPEVPQEYSTQK